MAPGVPPKASRSIGEWLSLVEHLVRDQGVGGSNPLSPTIIKSLMETASSRLNQCVFESWFCTAVPRFVPTS